MHELKRATRLATLTIEAAAAESDVLDIRQFAGGILVTPTGWDTNDIAFLVSMDGLTYFKLRDAENADIVIAGAEEEYSYPLPADAFGAHSLKIVSQSGGVDANQTAECIIAISLKG